MPLRINSCAEHTSTRGVAMIYLLFLLIPLVALLVWAAMYDWKRRRRGTPVPDFDAATRANRLDAERRAQDARGGGGGL